MTALDIFQHDGTLVVSSETIADGSGVQHASVLRVLDEHRNDFEAFGQVRFEIRPGYNNSSVRFAVLNEQQATLLMTFQRNTERVIAFKVALVKAFFEMARRLAQPAELSRSDLARMVLAAEAEKEALEAKITEDAPKVLFADSVAASESTILVGELAKILKGNGLDIGATRLFELLRDEGFLIKRKGTDWNMPTQYAMDLGLFRIKETAVTHSDGHVSVSKTPKVTGKGQAYFINRYITKALVAV